MMILYTYTNKISGNKYYGITRNMKRRAAAHKFAAKTIKTPFYDAVRKYGWDNFDCEVLAEGNEDFISQLEIESINKDPNCYNLHLGGHIGFDVTTKSKQEVQEWKAKLSMARVGRKPAQGMNHSEETKQICSDSGKKRWDMYGRYPAEVVNVGFVEANKKYGISKTHYYRLRKAAQK